MRRGLVFAGGASRRMGADKADLRIGGVTLLGRAIATVRAAGFEPLVMTPPRPTAALDGARQIDETAGGLPGGPLPALARGLEEVGGVRPVVVLACDLPLVPAALMRALADHPGDWDAHVPRAGGVLQVMAAAYRPSCRAAIRAALGAGDRSIHRWLGRVRLAILEEEALAPFGGQEIFLNVNTPADCDRAAAALAAGAPGTRPRPSHADAAAGRRRA